MKITRGKRNTLCEHHGRARLGVNVRQHRMRAALRITLCIVAGIAGCTTYKGDGSFTDHRTLIARYVLDLGHVDLDKPWRQEYSMTGLPSGQYTVGLLVVSPPLVEKPDIQGKVRLALTNEKGERVFEVEEELSRWVWGGGLALGAPFLFVRGVNNEIPIAGGGVRLEPITRADGGWGTYFSPRRDGQYRLVYETVVPVSGVPNLTVRLAAEGQ
jgi:hypothetical protein